MNLVAELMESAASDTDVLRSLNSNGDKFSVARDVEFLLIAPDREKATLVADFINDFSYGVATVQDDISVLVVVHMPVEQPVALCISGFFTCVARLFGVTYDGWGCVAQAKA